MTDADYIRLARSGALSTYMQTRRRQSRIRRAKLASAVALTLAAVAVVAWLS